jgi:hypothetical protein
MLYYLIGCCILFLTVVYSTNQYKKICYIKKYDDETIFRLLNNFMSKSYETIYNVDLVTFILSSVHPDTQQMETIERKYIKTCFLYMGDNIKKVFIDFFTNEQTLIVNMIMYMRKRLSEDGLTKIIDDHSKQNI